MSDYADQAQDVIEYTENARIQTIRNRLRRTGSKHCEDCDVLIPLKRRRLLPCAVTCVDCQARREFNQKVGQR